MKDTSRPFIHPFLEISLDTIKSLIQSLFVHIVAPLVVFVAVFGGLWYHFGTTTVVATVNGTPYEGANVEIDGKIVGQTPYSDRLGPGWHTVRVLPTRDMNALEEQFYVTFITAVRGTEVNGHFTSKSMLAETRIDCVINGYRSDDRCDVEVDGTYIGKAPIIVSLTPGEHEIFVLPPEDVDTAEDLWDSVHVANAEPTTVAANFTLR